MERMVGIKFDVSIWEIGKIIPHYPGGTGALDTVLCDGVNTVHMITTSE